jgi:hypothetical protein
MCWCSGPGSWRQLGRHPAVQVMVGVVVVGQDSLQQEEGGGMDPGGLGE